MGKLKSPKQEAFAQHYALNGNATEAYRKSYNTRTKKEAVLYSSASKLVNDPKVNTRIKELQEAASERADKRFKIDADWMLNRLKEIDDMDVADILEEDGNVKPISQWPKVWRTTISAVDLHEIQNAQDAKTVIRKLKLPDKAKNLEMLGKHVEVQAFKEQREVEHSASKSLSELLQEAKESS